MIGYGKLRRKMPYSEKYGIKIYLFNFSYVLAVNFSL